MLRQKVEEDFNLIEYEEGYLSPNHYFVKDSPYGRVYKVNKPKNNYVVVNQDTTLGGVRYCAPSSSSISNFWGLLGSNFDRSCLTTPRSTYY